MPASSVDRRLGAALALPVLILAAVPAIAETGPPGDEGGALFAPAPASAGGPRFEMRELKAPDPDSIGLLDDRHGGLGAAMWTGTDGGTVRRLLPVLPVGETRAARDLARRLLLTAAAAPVGTTVGAPLLLDLRAERLLALGDVKGLVALLKTAPATIDSAALARLEVDALLLTGEVKTACGGTAARRLDDPRLRVFCALSDGKVLEANMTLDLIRERKDSDPLFTAAADAMAGTPPPKLDKLPHLTPLHVAALRAARIPLPPEAAQTAAPALLGAIAAADTNPIDTRLIAAERAEGLGLIDTEALRRVYAALTVSPAEAQAASGQGDRTPRGRALLLRAVQAEPVPASRAGLIVRILAQATERGALAATARLYAPLIADLVPTPDLAVQAPALARALIVAGLAEAAPPWLEIARANPQTAPAAQAATLLLRLARPGGGPVVLPPPPEGVPPETVARRTEIALALAQGLGETVPAAQWLSSLRDPLVVATTTPRAGLKALTRAAAEDVRIGETVLLALIGLGEGGLDKIDADHLGRTLAYLRAIGLDRDARALAVEAALANGL